VIHSGKTLRQVARELDVSEYSLNLWKKAYLGQRKPAEIYVEEAWRIVDSVLKAGTPMALAPLVYTIWNRVMKFDPEGSTRITFTEDIAARFLGYGWNVLRVGDANDIDRIEQALEVFQRTTGRPTFIILDSHIGYGSPHKQDTAEAHGEPLGDDEIRLTKRSYGWPEDAKFLVPDGVREHFAAGIGARGAEIRRQWMDLFANYVVKNPELPYRFWERSEPRR
jgi:transketolase